MNHVAPQVEVLADSVGPGSVPRLTTMRWRYPRFIHSECMTHRQFCLAGDAQLTFDMPAGAGANRTRRPHKITVSEFVRKWVHGSAPHRSRWGSQRTYDLRPRLRQLDEATGDIQTAQITDAFESGVKKVYEVRAGKYTVAGSADHRVMTADGWRVIGDLKRGDFLAIATRQKPENIRSDATRLKKIEGRWRSRWQKEQGERLRREDGKCRICRVREGVEVHHLVPVYLAPDRAFDETNVTWVCEPCHKEIHATQGWQTGTPYYSGFVEVQDIRLRGEEETFDLSIAGSFPNFLANGVVVHNSRNAASSRAIPLHKLREQVLKDPAEPVHWGKAQKGMQARQELEPQDRKEARDAWLTARREAARVHEWMERIGLAKQVANRILEPWMWMESIWTATTPGWDNLLFLRDHPDAQPEFQHLAKLIRAAYETSEPRQLKEGEWHLPYFNPERDHDLAVDDVPKVCAARCARVSYLTHDGVRDPQKDLELFARLVDRGDEPRHLSPLEHIARVRQYGRADLGGNLGAGWHQLRKDYERPVPRV